MYRMLELQMWLALDKIVEELHTHEGPFEV